MFFIRRFLRGRLRLNRIEAFSDGVFAIIVTLLVLELKIPKLAEPANVQELAQQLLALMPKFFSWLISFIIVCKFWLNHHYILSLARHTDFAMMWINAIFLLGQSFVPFPSALMGEYPSNPLAVSFFGLVMAFNTVVFIALEAYIVRNLIKPEYAESHQDNFVRKALIGPTSYLVGAIGAWFTVYIAFAAYAITPLFYIVPPQAIDESTQTEV